MSNTPEALKTSPDTGEHVRTQKFEVLRRIDAYADYIALVEAESAEEAAKLARENEGAYEWEELGACQFDARYFVTLDANGDEIEETIVGDR